MSREILGIALGQPTFSNVKLIYTALNKCIQSWTKVSKVKEEEIFKLKSSRKVCILSLLMIFVNNSILSDVWSLT